MTTSDLKQDLIDFGRHYLIYFLPVTFLVYLILETYQIDFRSFYLAGKSVLLGLDPYLNYVGVRPEFYGPVNSETSAFSGFRYPPLAALVFAPWGAMAYQTSKAIFSLVMLIFLGLLAFHFVRQSRFGLPGEAILFMMMSFPVLALTERGQVDSFVVYLTVLSYWIYRSGKLQWLSTFLLAFAALFKVFPAVMLLYYAVHKKWTYGAQFFAWSVMLLTFPFLYFGKSVYQHFFQRTFPQVFGEIVTVLPIDLHGQGIVLNRVVQSTDAIDLVLTHDFVNGYMNPLLQQSTAGSILSGLILSGIMLLAVRQCPRDFQFYALLNVINLYNPAAWIMGLVWFLPLFFYLFPRVTVLGKMFLLFPLFMPPFLNTNAIWAYVVSILFALTLRFLSLEKALFKPHSTFRHSYPT